MPVKIAFDVSPLNGGHATRGIGAYTKRLVQALEQESKRAGEQELKIDFIDFSHQPSAISHQPSNLIHYPYFDLFFLTLPLKKPAKTVVTIHDVIPLVFPEHYPSGLRGKIKFLIQKFSLRGVDAVITDSQNSKKDIVRYLGYPAEKIHVVPLAPGEKFRLITNYQLLITIKRKYSLPEKFVLYVGDVNWNKNIPGLLKAIKQLSHARGRSAAADNLAIKLVLVGKAFKDESLPETKEILQLIKVLKIEDQVLRLGWVNEEDLVKIYNLATVYCQPSYYEGFGLPVLEAMACGCPVVAANTSSLPEICGEAALMINPEDSSDIAEGLKRLISDTGTRGPLIKKGFAQVKKFSWEKVARETSKVYETVVKE